MKTNVHGRLLAALLWLTIPNLLTAQSDELPSVLSLDRAEELALERSTLLLQSDVAIASADARVRSAFGAFLPSISLNAGYTRYLAQGDIVVEGTPIPGERPNENYRAGASATLNVFDGFGRSAGYSAARSDREAARYDRRVTEKELTWQVRQAFLSALKARQIVDLRTVNLETAQVQLERTKGLAEGGVALHTAVTAQEAEVARTQLSLIQARTNYRTARQELATALNSDPVQEFQVSPDGLAQQLDSTEFIANRSAIGGLDALLQNQLRRHPELLALRERIESAESSVNVAEAGYYPSLFASLGWGLDKTGLVESSNGTFNLSLQYPLFEGFRTDEQVQLAEAELTRREIELRRAELSIRNRLVQAWSMLIGAEQAVVAANRAVDAARADRFAAEERYNEGAGSYSDYLTANERFAEARINQINARFDYRLAMFEMDYLAW